MEAQSSGGFSGNTLDNPRDVKVEKEVKYEWEVVDEGGVQKEKEKEKCMPSVKKTESRIKEFEAKNIYGNRARMQSEDDQVLD